MPLRGLLQMIASRQRSDFLRRAATNERRHLRSGRFLQSFTRHAAVFQVLVDLLTHRAGIALRLEERDTSPEKTQHRSRAVAGRAVGVDEMRKRDHLDVRRHRQPPQMGGQRCRVRRRQKRGGQHEVRHGAVDGADRLVQRFDDLELGADLVAKNVIQRPRARRIGFNRQDAAGFLRPDLRRCQKRNHVLHQVAAQQSKSGAAHARSRDRRSFRTKASGNKSEGGPRAEKSPDRQTNFCRRAHLAARRQTSDFVIRVGVAGTGVCLTQPAVRLFETWIRHEAGAL